MKKITGKARERIKKISQKHRKNQGRHKKRTAQKAKRANRIHSFSSYIENVINRNGIDATIDSNRVYLSIPEKMNFYDDYEETTTIINLIRSLVKNQKKRGYVRLAHVNLDKLRSISTSAALALTAELSHWNDSVNHNNLTPFTTGWDPEILQRFAQLGFFELFFKKPSDYVETVEKADIEIVKYIKGRCGDKRKTSELKAGIRAIIGSHVSKWTFLDSGLSEAITNVTHHAYPKNRGFSEKDKNWYLTGGFNKVTRELKIVFYDQGIGIPSSLPASDIWEKVLSYMSIFPSVERRRDSTLLKAAVEIDRTSTEKNDRGKGLQDLQVFIQQRQNGYLSILSGHALYKYTLDGKNEKVKTETFKNPIKGTLIIWKVTLNEK